MFLRVSHFVVTMTAYLPGNTVRKVPERCETKRYRGICGNNESMIHIIKKNATFTNVVCYSVLMKHMLTKYTELFFYLFCNAVKHIITQRHRYMGTMRPRALETLRISLESESVCSDLQ